MKTLNSFFFFPKHRVLSDIERQMNHRHSKLVRAKMIPFGFGLPILIS